jgi:hypothetical protein
VYFWKDSAGKNVVVSYAVRLSRTAQGGEIRFVGTNCGVVSDGQRSIRNAVETALPEAAHGLCHFHYLKEAAKQIYEADRHAKRTQKQVRECERLSALLRTQMMPSPRSFRSIVSSALRLD